MSLPPQSPTRFTVLFSRNSDILVPLLFSDRMFQLRPRHWIIVSAQDTDGIQKQLTEVFLQKGVLKNFAKFTGKHLCQSLFLIRLQAKA